MPVEAFLKGKAYKLSWNDLKRVYGLYMKPHGVFMDKTDNLVSFTKENAVMMGRKGGLASVESKREQKQLIEQLREALYLPVTDETFAKKLTDEGLEPTYAGAVIFNVFRKAGKNAMMARLLFELLGELKPQGVTINNNNIIETDAFKQGYKAGQQELMSMLPEDVLRGIASGEIELKEPVKQITQ